MGCGCCGLSPPAGLVEELTLSLSLLRGDEDGAFAVLYLDIWSNHPKPLLQDLHTHTHKYKSDSKVVNLFPYIVNKTICSVLSRCIFHTCDNCSKH